MLKVIVKVCTPRSEGQNCTWTSRHFHKYLLNEANWSFWHKFTTSPTYKVHAKLLHLWPGLIKLSVQVLQNLICFFITTIMHTFSGAVQKYSHFRTELSQYWEGCMIYNLPCSILFMGNNITEVVKKEDNRPLSQNSVQLSGWPLQETGLKPTRPNINGVWI